jgi:uncharacterized membrane protein
MAPGNIPNYAGLVLGVGFSGLADRIILHHILGWHHLICYTVNCQPTSIGQFRREKYTGWFFHPAL